MKKRVEDRSTGKFKMSFGGIVIEDTDIEFFTGISATPKSGFKGINLDTGKVEFCQEKQIGENFSDRTPALKLNIGSSFIYFKKNGYKAESGPMRFGTAGSSLLIKDFRYKPASEELRKKKISQKGEYHKIEISEINLKNIDIKELTDNGRFRAGQLYFNNPEMYFFRNRNIRKKISINSKKLPQQIFREAILKVDIDLVRVKNGEIKYTEIPIGDRKGESLIFKELETSLHDLSNFPEILRTGKESKISISTRIMGESLLKGKIIIPINNRADRFSFSGSLAGTDPYIFNRFLKRNVKINIDKGRLNYMTFNVQADKEAASGHMRLSYDDLHITIMKKKGSLRKSRFETFLANTLTHKNNPTKKGRGLRTGKIQFERKSKNSIFNYMWKCLLSGIKSSIKI